MTIWKAADVICEEAGGTIMIDICRFFCFQSLKIRGAKPFCPPLVTTCKTKG